MTWPDLSTNPGSVSLVTPVTYTDSVNLPSASPPRRFLRLKVTSPCSAFSLLAASTAHARDWYFKAAGGIDNFAEPPTC